MRYITVQCICPFAPPTLNNMVERTEILTKFRAIYPLTSAYVAHHILETLTLLP